MLPRRSFAPLPAVVSLASAACVVYQMPPAHGAAPAAGAPGTSATATTAPAGTPVGAPPPPPPAPPAAAEPVAPSLPPAATWQPEPGYVAGPVAASAALTDHDQVVGHWGLEARRVDGFYATNQGRTCDPANPASGGGTASCPLSLNAFTVRRWITPHYAWDAGLVLGIGGGKTSAANGAPDRTWDTYVGVGPTIGASFLLSNWKHLAVSAAPQLDVVYFAPSGSGTKTVLVNARGLLEGELHLGFIGVPALSVGLASGLVVNFRHGSNGAPSGGAPETSFAVGFAGPRSLWDLVTTGFLRFYL